MEKEAPPTQARKWYMSPADQCVAHEEVTMTASVYYKYGYLA